MLPLFTSAEMREMDRSTSEDFGILTLVLMDHAGRAVARAAQRLLDGRDGPIAVVCGKGNNGGDGFVAARWLAQAGRRVTVDLFADPAELRGDALVNFTTLQRLGLPVYVAPDGADLRERLVRSAVIVDALLGTGLNGPPRPPFDDAVSAINGAGRPVLAVDVPSGINADTGAAYPSHVRATATITLGALKVGLVIGPAADAAGQVEVADIGLPARLVGALADRPALLQRGDLAYGRLSRRPSAHKGEAGRVLLLAGSSGFCGAAALATRAAARGGAGLVTLVTPAAVAPLVAAQTVEAMVHAAPGDPQFLGMAALDCLLPLLEGANALAVGPGLGTRRETAELLRAMAQHSQAPLVVDADALNLLAQQPDLFADAAGRLVLTPHPGEAARLLGTTVPAVQDDRLAAAAELTSRYRAVTLLKGRDTIVMTLDGRRRVILGGTPAMASGGMGDALTGLLAALLAQGGTLVEAVELAVWLHQRAGQRAARGPVGLLAGDLIDELPATMAELTVNSSPVAGVESERTPFVAGHYGAVLD